MTRPYKCIFRGWSVATVTGHHLYERVKFWSVPKKIETFTGKSVKPVTHSLFFWKRSHTQSVANPAIGFTGAVEFSSFDLKLHWSMHQLVQILTRRFNQSFWPFQLLLNIDATSIALTWSTFTPSIVHAFCFHLPNSLVFHYIFDTLIANWAHWITSMGPTNPTNLSSQILLVLLIMLSHNYQNHKL